MDRILQVTLVEKLEVLQITLKMLFKFIPQLHRLVPVITCFYNLRFQFKISVYYTGSAVVDCPTNAINSLASSMSSSVFVAS